MIQNSGTSSSRVNCKFPRHRCADAELTLLSAEGSPRPNLEATITQTRQAFLFGVGGFDIVKAQSGITGAEKERTDRRVEQLTGLFNAVTLPFYWGLFEPNRGEPGTELLRKAARWCTDHHLCSKGHPLCWHTLTADWLLALRNEEILQAQIERIRREVSGFRGLIDSWDVINEAVIMPVFEKYDNGITRICKALGRIQTVKTMFEAARGANPQATLLLNDFDLSPAFDILVEGCLEAGIRIDVIGIQSHMHQGYWGVEKTLEVLDHFTRFQLPIHFTETTLVSGELMPHEIIDLNDYQVADWPSTPKGEERQARETALHYRTLFEHPLVTGITWWDLADGGWLNAPAGLLWKDGAPKPAYAELQHMIKEEWQTPSMRLQTDASGKLCFTGFLGDYELECSGKRVAVSLDKPGTRKIEITI